MIDTKANLNLFTVAPKINPIKKSFCNTVYTINGGTHEVGFKQELLKRLENLFFKKK